MTLTIDVEPLSPVLGAKIRGIDLSKPVDKATQKMLYQAFVDHSIITIRGQDIAPEDHLAFARRFGSINVNRFFKKLDTHPEIAVVLKEKDQKKAIGERWHTDHSYDQVPAMGSILHAIEVPPFGGDTPRRPSAAAPLAPRLHDSHMTPLSLARTMDSSDARQPHAV